MAARCHHPENRLTYAGSSVEDAAVGRAWPTKVHWYSCGVCGSEVTGPAPGSSSEEAPPPTTSKKPYYENPEDEPF